VTRVWVTVSFIWGVAAGMVVYTVIDVYRAKPPVPVIKMIPKVERPTFWQM
jgi:hypothetical protein